MESPSLFCWGWIRNQWDRHSSKMNLPENKIRARRSTTLELLSTICFLLVTTVSLILIIFFFIFILYNFFIPPLSSLLIRSFPAVFCTVILLKLLLTKPQQNGTRNGKRFSRPHSVRRRNINDARRLESVHQDRPDVLPAPTFEDSNGPVACESEIQKGFGSISESTVTSPFTSSNDPMNGLEWDATSEEATKGEADMEGRARLGEGRMIVDWTQDDEKNLLDLGISEIERNKRLESLIAKRMARKLVNSRDGKTPIIPHLVARTKSLNVSLIGSGDAAPSPGSAPCVLLPMHNPFDLPYDSQEEKPNLTGDNFLQELLPNDHKDLSFCRHENSNFEPSFSAGSNCRNHEMKSGTHSLVKRRAAHFKLKPHQEKKDRREFSKRVPSRMLPDEYPKHDERIGQIPCKHETLRHCNDIHLMNLTEGRDSDVFGSLSSTEENDPNSNIGMDEVPQSLNSTRNMLSEACGYSNSNKGSGHIAANSISSNLQVDSLEVGSKLLTVGDALMYDGDAGKAIASGSEEAWGVSLYPYGMDENRTRLKYEADAGAVDASVMGISQINPSSEDPISSSSIADTVVEHSPIEDCGGESEASTKNPSDFVNERELR